MARAGTSSSRPRELADRGEEFALATVVWRQAPSSGQTRRRAPSSPRTGELHGWIGGACAEPVVIREAQRVIADRRAAAAAARRRPEPVRRRPGRDDRHPDRPARARAPWRSTSNRSAQPRTWSSSAARRWPTRSRRPRATPSAGARRSVDGADFTRRRSTPRVDRGRRHPGPRRRGGHRAGASAARPAFVGLVASRKRGRGACSATSPTGASRRTSSTGCACRSGSTSGHTSHREIAVADPRRAGAAARRRRAQRPPGARPSASASRRPPPTAIDPVCGMTVTADASSRRPARARRHDVLLLLRRLPRPRSPPTPPPT